MALNGVFDASPLELEGPRQRAGHLPECKLQQTNIIYIQGLIRRARKSFELASFYEGFAREMQRDQKEGGVAPGMQRTPLHTT